MRIILLEKVVNLGNLGSVVRVKGGHARDFLIPNKQARRATDPAIKEFEAHRAELEKLTAEKLAAAQVESEKLNDLTLQLSQETGVDGRLFGSVTNHDIADALVAQGLKVEKAQVHMPNGPLKTIGDHSAVMSLRTDVAADMTVSVQGGAV